MKKITIQLKRIGKKKVKSIPFQLIRNPNTLDDLIKACVESEVARYNKDRKEVELIGFLSPSEIQNQSKKGKIGFGDKNNLTLAEVNTAIDNALLAFKDGLFAVFIDDEPIEELNTKISIQEETTIAFLRLTFLSGAYW